MSVPKTMKALVAYGSDDYRLELAYPTSTCGPDDIIIKTEACGICAGDLKCRHGAAMFWGDETQPAWVEPPFTPGHEFIGTVVRLGKEVKGYAIGDRVTADQIVPCRDCRFCRTGKYWMCQPHRITHAPDVRPPPNATIASRSPALKVFFLFISSIRIGIDAEEMLAYCLILQQ